MGGGQNKKEAGVASLPASSWVATLPVL